MFVGTLTRDSVLKAVSSGISSQEIIAYLQSRAHPQALARPPDAAVVPEVRWRPCVTPKASSPWMPTNSRPLYAAHFTLDMQQLDPYQPLIIWPCLTCYLCAV